MKFSSFAAAALLAASASAFEILTPAAANSSYHKGQEVTIKYSAVDTDQEYFGVALSNLQEPNRPVTFILGEDAHRDAGSVTVRIPCTGLDYTEGWKFWFINETNVYQILAESKYVFNIAIHTACVDPPTAPKPTPTPASYGSSPIYNNGTKPHYGTVTKTHTFCSTSVKVTYPTDVIIGVVVPVGGGKGPEGPKGPGNAGYPTGPAGGACAPTVTATVTVTKTEGAGGPGGYPVKTPTPEGTKTYGAPGASGTGKPAGYPTGPSFTGAASSLQVSGAAGLLVAAVAFML